MAAPGVLAVMLVVLLGLLDTTRVSATKWGQKHFFKLAAFEESGCLVKNFENRLPATLWVNAMICRRQHPIDSTGHHYSHAPGAEVLSPPQRRALYLHCLAQRLDIISDTGIDEGKLDAFINTLPAEPELTSHWKANVDTCLLDMGAGLTPARQAVYLLSCLRERLVIDCAEGTDVLCLRSKFFRRFKFSRNSAGLDSSIVWRRCGRQVTAKGSAFTSRGRTDTDFCPDLMNKSVAIAACALRESGHASGDALNMTAVRETIMQQAEQDGQFASSQRMTALERCKDGSVDAFVRCWGVETPAMAVTSSAHLLAMALPLPAPPSP